MHKCMLVTLLMLKQTEEFNEEIRMEVRQVILHINRVYKQFFTKYNKRKMRFVGLIFKENIYMQHKTNI